MRVRIVLCFFGGVHVCVCVYVCVCVCVCVCVQGFGTCAGRGRTWRGGGVRCGTLALAPNPNFFGPHLPADPNLTLTLTLP